MFVEEISGGISTLHGLSCQHQGKSLRVFGTHGVHRFQVLIDSGSTHNFIKPTLVGTLGHSNSRNSIYTSIHPFREMGCKYEVCVIWGVWRNS